MFDMVTSRGIGRARLLAAGALLISRGRHVTATRVRSPAEEFSAFLQDIRKRVQRIRSVDHHDTHAFVEDKDRCARDLDRAETMFRARFGASPSKIRTGTIVGPTGRKVTVERRKSAEPPSR